MGKPFKKSGPISCFDRRMCPASHSLGCPRGKIPAHRRMVFVRENPVRRAARRSLQFARPASECRRRAPTNEGCRRWCLVHLDAWPDSREFPVPERGGWARRALSGLSLIRRPRQGFPKTLPNAIRLEPFPTRPWRRRSARSRSPRRRTGRRRSRPYRCPSRRRPR